MRPLASVSLPLVAAVFAACGSDSDPMDVQDPCTDDTGTVSVTVSGTTATPTFDWEPACAVALVLVEEGGSDRWGVSTDDALWSDPAASNLIEPPVTYGVVPTDTDEFEPPATLLAGTTYDLVIWRVPPGSTTDCLVTGFGACQMAVYAFTP